MNHFEKAKNYIKGGHQGGPPPPPPPPPGENPKTWTMAFGWHIAGHELEPRSLRPLFQPYDSSSPVTIAENVREWRAGGVQFVATDWFGLSGTGFGEHITASVQGYQDSGFPAAVYLDDIAGGLDACISQVRRWVAENPRYPRFNGRPILFIYSRVYGKLSPVPKNATPEQRRAAMESALAQLLPLNQEFYLVLDGIASPDRLPVQKGGLGCHWFGVPFIQPERVTQLYEAVQAREDLSLFPLLYHGYNSTDLDPAQVGSGTVYPPGGSTLQHFQGQVSLARRLGTATLGVPWDELGEQSAFVPTQEFGRLYTDAMGAAFRDFLEASPTPL